jgi:hypothetical protein
MRTITRTAFALAAVLATGPFAAASAQEAFSYPRIVGSGENASVEYGPSGSLNRGGNIVGGGYARVVGSGESASVVYQGPVRAQPPLYAFAIGSGEQTQVIHSAQPDRDVALAEAGITIPASQGPSLFASLFGRRG